MEDEDTLRARAYHEGAHALVGYVLRCPRLKNITIEPDGCGNTGYCLPEEWPYLETMPWATPSFDAWRNASDADKKEAFRRYKETADRHADVPPLNHNAVLIDRLARDICSRLAGLEGALLVLASYNRNLAKDDHFWVQEHTSQIERDPAERRKLITRQLQRARRILRRHRYALDVLARTLMEHGTLDGREAEVIIDAAMVCERPKERL